MNAALIIIAASTVFALVLGIFARSHHKMSLEEWTVGGRHFGALLVFLLLGGEMTAIVSGTRTVRPSFIGRLYMIYTIGHSNHPIDRLVALLQQHHIEALADVRSNPYSRFNPQFNREKLQASLAARNSA